MLNFKQHSTSLYLSLILLLIGGGAQGQNPQGVLELLYSGGIPTFAKLQIRIRPGTQAIRFDSWQGKRISMDCQKTDDSNWSCSNPCSKGSVTLTFSSKGFCEVKVQALNIVPRQCDGTASQFDRPVKTETPLLFEIKAKEGQSPCSD